MLNSLLVAASAALALGAHKPAEAAVPCEVAQVVVSHEVVLPAMLDATPLGPPANRAAGIGWGKGPVPSKELTDNFTKSGDQGTAAECPIVVEDLKRRGIRLQRQEEVRALSRDEIRIRVGMPVVNASADEAIVTVQVTGGTGLGFLSRQVLLVRNSAGVWTIVNGSVTAIS